MFFTSVESDVMFLSVLAQFALILGSSLCDNFDSRTSACKGAVCVCVCVCMFEGGGGECENVCVSERERA